MLLDLISITCTVRRCLCKRRKKQKEAKDTHFLGRKSVNRLDFPAKIPYNKAKTKEYKSEVQNMAEGTRVTGRKTGTAGRKWLAAAVVVVALAVIAAVLLRPRPLKTAEGYIAAPRETARIYDEDGGTVDRLVRGTPVTYVVEEEDKDHPGMIRLVLDKDVYAWVKTGNVTDDPEAVVTTKKLYVRTPVNLTDASGAVPGTLVRRGDSVDVIGWDGPDKEGRIRRYKVRSGDEEGYVRAGYLCYTEKEARDVYDAKLQKLHTARGDSWGGGNAKNLDYYPRHKPHFKKNVMPDEVKALYLNNASIDQADTYIKIARSSGINAFVVDIQDGGAIGYASPTMKKYSPSAYEGAYNTLESYQTGVQKLKDAGFYVIGRITTFNDPNFAVDHPECLIAEAASGKPMEIGGMYWPSAYNRYVWQYKVDLAVEAVQTMGFNEIQFDYVRFPDGTWMYDDGVINYRNTYGESKAQAIQRFLMYACDRLHAEGVYVSCDVFGECAEDYVCAYGQYWPAISNVVDAISAMPYPDHYSASGSWLPWEHPYESMETFGLKAAQRQKETSSPALCRCS